jgi:hypothetical protein
VVRVHRLDWDSDFFGIGIGRIELQDADPTAIREAEAGARDLGIACLYGDLDPTRPWPTVAVQALGYRLVDVATTFELRIDEPEVPCPDGLTWRVGEAGDVPTLTPIVQQLAPWSRYAVDPRFGPAAAERVQAAWLQRAVADPDGDRSILLAEQDGRVVAFIGRVRTPHPRVDAVGSIRPGSGAARSLIQEARRWAGAEALLGGPIAARNVRALRFVSRCGYRVASVEYRFHRWLDEAV